MVVVVAAVVGVAMVVSHIRKLVLNFKIQIAHMVELKRFYP